MGTNNYGHSSSGHHTPPTFKEFTCKYCGRIFFNPAAQLAHHNIHERETRPTLIPAHDHCLNRPPVSKVDAENRRVWRMPTLAEDIERDQHQHRDFGIRPGRVCLNHSIYNSNLPSVVSVAKASDHPRMLPGGASTSANPSPDQMPFNQYDYVGHNIDLDLHL